MSLKFDGSPCCDLYEIELKNNHCCELMTECAHDTRIGIEYSPKFRSYYLLIEESSAIQLLDFCPWCGVKLPKYLYDEYYEAIKQEYDLEDPYDSAHDSLVSAEFKTNEWWKKRGL